MSVRRPFSWVALSLIGALLLLVGVLAGRSLLSPQYEAVAVVELAEMYGKARADVSRILDENRNLMQSAEFLEAVVDRLEITRSRGISREQAIKALGREVSVGGIDGTDLLSIQASHRQKEEALVVVREILAEFVRIKDWKWKPCGGIGEVGSGFGGDQNAVCNSSEGMHFYVRTGGDSSGSRGQRLRRLVQCEGGGSGLPTEVDSVTSHSCGRLQYFQITFNT